MPAPAPLGDLKMAANANSSRRDRFRIRKPLRNPPGTGAWRLRRHSCGRAALVHAFTTEGRRLGAEQWGAATGHRPQRSRSAAAPNVVAAELNSPRDRCRTVRGDRHDHHADCRRRRDEPRQDTRQPRQREAHGREHFRHPRETPETSAAVSRSSAPRSLWRHQKHDTVRQERQRQQHLQDRQRDVHRCPPECDASLRRHGVVERVPAKSTGRPISRKPCGLALLRSSGVRRVRTVGHRSRQPSVNHPSDCSSAPKRSLPAARLSSKRTEDALFAAVGRGVLAGDERDAAVPLAQAQEAASRLALDGGDTMAQGEIELIRRAGSMVSEVLPKQRLSWILAIVPIRRIGLGPSLLTSRSSSQGSWLPAMQLSQGKKNMAIALSPRSSYSCR